MSQFTQMAKVDELKDGGMKSVSIDGREVLLAKVAGKYYAADNRCPHMSGNLSQGKLEGTVVTCPRHNSQFDLTDGHIVRWLKGTGFGSILGKALKSSRPLPIYNVKIEDDKIMVEI